MAKSYNSIKAGWKNPNSSSVGKRKSYKDIKASDYDFGVDESYIESFINDSQKFITESQANYNKVGYKEAKSAYEQNQHSAADLRDRASTIKAYFNANKGRIQGDYSSLMEYLDDYGKASEDVLGAYRGKQEYFSQWADEDAYNRAMAYAKEQDEKAKKYSSMTDDELEAELKSLEDSKKGNAFTNFGLLLSASQQQDAVNMADMSSKAVSNKEHNDKVDYDIDLIKKEKTNRKYKQLDELPGNVKTLVDELTVIDSTNDEEEFANKMATLLSGFTGGSNVNYNVGSGSERRGEIIQELEGMGVENWQELLDYNKLRYNEEKNASTKEEYAQMAKEHPILSSFISVPASIGKGIGTLEMIENIGSNVPLDPNSPYFGMNDLSNTIRDTVMDEYDYHLNTGIEAIDNADIFDELYSTVMSTADSATAGLGGMGVKGLGGSVLGLSAASDAAQEVAVNGGSSSEAIATGLVSGVNEMLWETISLGQLDDLITNGVKKRGFVPFVKELLKSMGINASEEFNTEVANLVGDYIINGGASTYAERIKEYLAVGYTEEEARKLANKDMLSQSAKAGFSGALQGLLMGIGGGALSTTTNAIDSKSYENKFYNKMGSNVIANNKVSDLVGEAKDLGNSKLAKLANVAEGVNAEELSTKEAKKYAHQVGKLYKGVQQAQFDNLSKTSETAYRNVIKAEVEKTGVADVDATTDILVKVMRNKGLTRAENRQFQSVNGRSVLDKVINSAEFDKALDAEQVKQYTEAFKKVVNTNNLGRDINAEKKADLLSGNKYTLSSDDKITIDATDENVDSMLITSLDGDDITLDVETGDKKQTVLAGELRLNEDYAVIFEGLRKIKANFGLDETTANNMLTLWKRYSGDSWDFYKGIESSFMFGKYNMRYDFEKSIEANKLPEDIREEVFELGRIHKDRVTKEESEYIKKNATTKATGKVAFAKSVTYEELTEEQKVQVDAAKLLAEIFKFDLEIFRSPKVNGVSKGESGSYTMGTGLMRLDVDAGTLNGKSLLTFTQGHELTHFIKNWSPEKYKIFADFLVENYNKKGVSVDELVRKKITNSIYAAENNDDREALTYEQAFDEVVAESCVNFLADPKLREKLLEIKKVDKGLYAKIKEFLKNLIAKLEKAIEGLTGESVESRHVGEFDINDLQKLKDLWVEALKDSRKNIIEAQNRTAEEQKAIKAFGKNLGNVETNKNGDITLISSEDNSIQMYSEATWLNGGKEALINALTRNEHTPEEIRDTIKMVEESLDYLKILAAGDAEMRGYTELSNHLVADVMTDVIHGKQVLHTIVNNGDYPVNLDLALICKKRVAYMRLMSRLIEDGVMEDVRYDGDAIAKVNEILRKNGFETACLGCFVESRRLQFQTWAEVIVQEWNGEVARRNKNAGDFNYAKNALADASSLTEAEISRLEKELEGKKTNDQGNLNLGQGSVRTKMGKLLDQVPTLQKHITVADLLTPEGITKLKAENPNLFSLVKSRYGAASPKIVQNYNPYASEIANLTFDSVKKITTNAVSGAKDYIAAATEELKDIKPVKPSKMKASEYNASQEKLDWDAKVQTLAMRKYLYDIGGARMQSFSDFMIENVFDYLQIFADLSANRFPLHSYTKEAAFLRLFGMTGAKINGSLIAHVDKRFGKQYAGLLPAEEAKNGNAILVHTADGDFAIGFDDYARHLATKGTKGETFIQSIGMKDIIALQMDKRYSSNVGSITIGVSDIQILAMLDSPLFRMVIPYHASGMLPQFAELVGVDLYNDYTDYQNTTVRQYYDINKMPLPDEVDKDGKVKQGKLRKANGDEIKADTSYSFNAELQKIGDPKQVANNYIAWCNEFHEIYDGDTLVGYAKFNPKFSNSPYGTDFTKHENYYKLLEDFNVYDGITEQYAAQGAVQMIFPSADNRLSAQEMEEYKQRLRDTGIFNEKEIEKYAQKANMTFDELVKAEVKNRIAYEDVQEPKFEATVKEVESALLKGYKRIDQRIKSYDDFVKLKDSTSKADKEALKNMKPMTRTYFQDRDSTGRELSPGQIEFFKDSKVRDEDGNLLVVYHGTPNKFTTFRQRVAQGWGKGIYFTDNKEDASEYGENIIEAYLNITNPYIADTMSYNNIGAEETKAYRDFDKQEWQNRFDEYETYEEYKADGMGVDMYDIYTEEIEVFNKILRELGYDGIIAKESNNINGLEIVAFNENQPKLTDNLNPTENEDIRYQDRYSPVDLSKDNELSKLIGTKTGSEKYAAIRDYIWELLGNTDIVFSDGTSAVIDKSDALHIANKAYDQKTAEISVIKELIKSAVLFAEDHTEHKKFNYFKYYAVNVKYGNDEFPIYLNVGRGKNDGLFHLYDITKKIRDTANRINGFEGLREFPSINSISVNSISNITENVNTKYQDRPVSDREILVDAMSNIDELSIEDKNRLEIYRGKIDNINSLERELADVGKQIHKIITTKGSDRKQMAELNAKAETLRKQISRVDGELLKIEAMKPIQNLVEIRKKQIIKAQNQKAQEQRHKSVEGRQKTASKNKIKRVVQALASLYNNPTKERNVKIEFQDMVEKALVMADAIFDNGNISVYDILSSDIPNLRESERKDLEKWRENQKLKAGYQRELDELEASEKLDQATHDRLLKGISECNRKLNYYSGKLKEVIEVQRGNLNDHAIQNAIDSLVSAYKSLNESTEGYAQAAYNEYVDKRLVALKEALKNTTIKTMTQTQLDELYQAYKMVLTTVRKANELFIENKKMTVADAGETVMREVQNVAKVTENKVAMKQNLNKFMWEELKPVYAFERIGSETFMNLYKEILRGQSVFGRDIDETVDFFQRKSKAYNYDSWDLDERRDFKLVDGRTFTISLQEIMSIYAYSKREQALDHITKGGFVFDSNEFFTDNKEKGIKGKIKKVRTTVEAYRLNDETFYKVINSLTPEQKKFVDDMQDYLSTVMGAKGNEVSRELYGIDLFREKYYFPLMSSHDFIQQTNNPAGEVALKNSGMAKATVPHARNPIILKGFMDVWSEHVNKMSTYHAFVLPIENLNKVFNYTGYATDNKSVSVQTILNGAYGPAVNQYITTLLQDLNGGIKVQGSGNWVTKGISLFKKTAVAASTSVVIQQPTAIVRALAMIDGKYFVHGRDGLKHNEAWDELKKYAPIAVIKEMGGFDVGGGKMVAEYITAKSYKGLKKVGGFFKDSKYRDEALMWGASKADEFGWITIWSAVKKEIADTTTYKVGSEEFLQACGERFTEVIDYTQVYDSVLSRSGFMRNKGEISKMATSFMGEPTTSFNMLYNAVLQLKRGNISKLGATKIVGATMASIIFAAIAKSLIYALRDDDEDEAYAEKYAQALTDSLKSDLFIPNMLPYVSDITSLLSGWEVERTDMAILKDLKDAIDGLDSSSKSPYRKVEDLAGAIAAFGGIPLKNIMRTTREMYNAVANILDGNTADFDDVGDAVVESFVGETSAADVNEALEKGNTAKAKEIINELVTDKVESGKTEKEAKASIKASVTSYWKGLYLQAYRNKDNAEMLRIRRILQATGLYDDVLTTCSNWIKGMKDETIDTGFTKW